MVKQSNTAQKQIAIRIPFFAVSGESAAAQRWKNPGSIKVHAAIKNHTNTYWAVLPPNGSRNFDGKALIIAIGESNPLHKKPSNRIKPRNIKMN